VNNYSDQHQKGRLEADDGLKNQLRQTVTITSRK